MAKRTFLTERQFKQACEEFQVSQQGLSGVEGSRLPGIGKEFSLWLGERLLKKMQGLEGWEEAGPIALGSWARDELCPGSDVDLLFVGEEKVVKNFVDACQDLDIRLRYRVPEDPEDWTKGVEAFDVLALLGARAFSWEAGEKLAQQQELVKGMGATFKRSLLSAIGEERKARNERHDSISSFLEPNLKYGAGGLRDLQQALHIYELYPDRFNDAHMAMNVFKEYKDFLLAIRQKLHLLGGAEVLTAHHQHELSDWMHFENPLDFMKALQSGLSKVSFFADWMLARAKDSKVKISEIENIKLRSLPDAFNALNSHPTILMQGRVRSHVEGIFSKGVSRKQVGRLLGKSLKVSLHRDVLHSLFRSRFLELCLPQLARVIGHSQHDHYHRFTLDEHIRQSVLALKKVFDQPKNLGRLSFLAKSMTDSDWRILLWTCIYHDLGKGLGGDHSTKGAKLVKKEFVQMGLSLRLTVEVAWLVKNHLVLSTAAFRMNPHSPQTWKRLHDFGVKGKRLQRLALFTAIDIQSTNPEAWTDWKEHLMSQLLEVLTQPQAERFRSLLAMAEAKKVKVSQEYLNELDPMVLEGVPTAVLLKDYQDLKASKKDLPMLVLRNKKGETWVRFHRRRDESGLFLEFVGLLSALGCRVRQSSIKTIDNYGVYDWFQVKTSKSPGQLMKMSTVIEFDVATLKPSSAKFHSIETTGEEEGELTISLRGKDQKGLLLAAAETFRNLDLQISWARVHTWGRQIEDVFSLKTKMEPETLIAELEDQLLDPETQLLSPEKYR